MILISLDTLRADRLGAYGYPRPTSPYIDALARDGVLYTNATAPSPWTVPSHVSLLTGLYPNQHQVLSHEQSLSKEIATLSSILAEHSFDTLGIVSAGVLLGDVGVRWGFERFEYVDPWHTVRNRRRIRNPGKEISELAISWLAEPRDRPFFVFLHYYDVHSAYTPTNEYRKLFVEEYDGPFDGTTAQLVAVRNGNKTLEPSDLAYLSQLYDGEVRQVDAEIGRLVAYLDESGLSQTTTLVILSDHGEELMEHGTVLHGTAYYEESIAVPLIIRGPDVPHGARIDEVASLVDVAPTVLGMLGIDVPENMQGIDLRSDWSPQGRRTPRPLVYAEADWRNEVPDLYRMVRDQRYKLIYNKVDASTQLFDLENDPHERNDLSDRDAETLKRLTQSLRKYMASAKSPRPARTVAGDELERLRALGYAD